MTSEPTLPADAIDAVPSLPEADAATAPNPDEYFFELLEMAIALQGIEAGEERDWKSFFSNLGTLNALPQVAAVYDRLALLRELDADDRKIEAGELAPIVMALLPQQMQDILNRPAMEDVNNG